MAIRLLRSNFPISQLTDVNMDRLLFDNFTYYNSNGLFQTSLRVVNQHHSQQDDNHKRHCIIKKKNNQIIDKSDSTRCI